MIDIRVGFGHRWRIYNGDGRDYVACKEGRIRAAEADFLQLDLPQGDLSEKVLKLPFVQKLRNDRFGVSVKFKEHRIHCVLRAGVQPIELRSRS